MFSKTKPEKVYRFKFRNDQFHSDDEDVYCKQLSPEHIISISVYESQFESSEEQVWTWVVLNTIFKWSGVLKFVFM